MTEQEETLWDAHESNPTKETRNALVEQYRELAHGLALRRHRSLSNSAMFDLDDLQTEAEIGLIELIDSGRFDRSQGVKFTTFASRRISGAMGDRLRQNDWVPRLEREREKKHGTTPAAMVRVAFVDSRYEYASKTEFTPDNNDNVAMMPEDERENKAGSRIESNDFWRETLRACSKTERLIMLLYYREDMTMADIGKHVGLSESRVSQVHTDMKRRLRVQMCS